jgi:hypothetical protein
MEIHIKTIPHNLQNYPTVGDYWTDENGVLQIRVSEMNDFFYNGMVMVHELIEWLLCRKAGITEKKITDFDLKFEIERQEGNLDEPGFAPNAPYIKQHSFATSVELGMCAMAGVDFMEYDKKVNEL